MDRVRRRRAALGWAGASAVLVVIALLATGQLGAGEQSGGGAGASALRRIQVGRGARGATIVLRGPERRRRPVIVFLHGWGLLGPRAYRAWADHLARRGNAVIMPRYQRSIDEPPENVLDNALAGIRAALRRIPVDRASLVVAGHSAGAALAADYAAVADTEGLPRPVAVFAVYPGRALRRSPTGIPARDASLIAPATRIVVLAGTRDEVVGEKPAQELFDSASAVPNARRRLVIVQAPAVARHYAPVFGARPVRRLIWSRLDRLTATARR